MSKQSDLPIQLLMWIKRQQEEERNHREKMVKKYAQEDKEYMRYISFIVQSWGELNRKEKELVLAFTTHHTEHKNFSVNQRSAIAAMYMKHHLAA